MGPNGFGNTSIAGFFEATTDNAEYKDADPKDSRRTWILFLHAFLRPDRSFRGAVLLCACA